MKQNQANRHRQQTYGYTKGKEGRTNYDLVLKNKGINNSTHIL